MLLSFVSAFCGFVVIANCANILFLLPVPSPSHRLWNDVLIEGLAARGHNLTVLSVEYERSRPNVTFIHLEKVYESLAEWQTAVPWNIESPNSFNIIKQHYQFQNFISRRIFDSKGIEQLARYPRDFPVDAIIYDFTLAQSLLAFVEHFGHPPLISVSPLALPQSLLTASTTQLFPSFIAHFSTAYTATSLRARVSERFMNMIYHTFDWFYRKYVYMKNENARIDGSVLGENKLKLEQLEESQLVLINRNFAFDDALALPPNVLSIGGLQVERSNELPNDVSCCC